MNKYSSYRSEMVSTDGRTDGRTDERTDRRTDTEGYNIISRHTLVAGYKKAIEIKCVRTKKQLCPISMQLHVMSLHTIWSILLLFG